MCVTTSYAHDSDKAFFDITTENNTTVVVSEFSWSIRSALKKFDPNFVNARTEEEINQVFFNYAKSHLKIFKKNGDQLKLIKVILDKNPEHHHSTNYKLIYEGKDIASITNTLLLEHIKSQENFHFYTSFDGVKRKSVTNAQKKTFSIVLEKNVPYTKYYIVGAVLLSICLLLFYLFLKQKN